MSVYILIIETEIILVVANIRGEERFKENLEVTSTD